MALHRRHGGCPQLPKARYGFPRARARGLILPGGDGRQILRSIHEKLMPLPDDTVVIPGHGENTTMGREKQFNYFLRELA